MFRIRYRMKSLRMVPCCRRKHCRFLLLLLVLAFVSMATYFTYFTTVSNDQTPQRPKMISAIEANIREKSQLVVEEMLNRKRDEEAKNHSTKHHRLKPKLQKLQKAQSSLWKMQPPKETTTRPFNLHSSNSSGIMYRAAYNPSLIGKSFQVSDDQLNYLHIPIPQDDLITLTDDNAKHFVVVTAASSGFYHGILAVLEYVQMFLPDHKIIVYDMGLKDEDHKALQAICQVEVRHFNFEQYPPHVRDLRVYAWKPLIVHEVMQTYPGVLWLDSSIRLLTGNMSEILRRAVHITHGAVMLAATGHSNFAVTHPQMFHFLPSDVEKLKVTQQWEANSMLLYRTHSIYTNVVRWWVMCALDKQCMAPTGAEVYCRWPSSDRYNHHGRCHRYDQAAINILLANLFSFDDRLYYASSRLVSVFRGQSGEVKRLKRCSSHNTR